MKITRVYTGEDNRSHFEDIEIPLTIHDQMGSKSEIQATAGVIFRSTDEEYEYDFHNAPCRQYVVNLEGILELEVGSGEKRRLNPGDVLLGEDVTGEGHITRAVVGPGRSLFIPLE